MCLFFFFFFQAEDGIRDLTVTGVQTCALPILLTDDAELAVRLKRLALHGMSADAWSRFSDQGYKHYQVVEPGYKFNMTDINAVMGLIQLRKLPQMLERREELWRQYDQKLADLPLTLPPAAEP